jgi:hypothetical protein
MRVQDSGFGVWGLEFEVWGLGFGVWNLGFGIWSLTFGVWDLEIEICGCGMRVASDSFQVCRVWGAGSDRV